MDIVLIPGLWLDGSAWDPVLPELQRLGHRPIAVTPPGLGDASVTLDDQVAAVLAAVDATAGPVLVVGHSAASTLAWFAADRRPDRVAAAVMIGGFPSADGTAYADFFRPVDGLVPFPGWAEFEGPDTADLDVAARRELAAGMRPVPAAVVQGVVHLQDPRRYGVRLVLICPEFSPDQVRGWMAAGELPELAAAQDVDLVDLDSGHWPMATRPVELAGLIAAAAG